jgi:LytS/YehU family sensor histidine kinase
MQMNPHFIFNALQSIQIKIADGDRAQARDDLQLFSKLMRGYLEHAREEKILLEDEIALLNQYLQVEQSLKAGSFDYQITVPDEIDPSFIEIPAMLLQPFIENAIKHGLPQNGVKGQINVTFSWFGKYLSCAITDNGSGMSFTKDSAEHRSMGMDITRQRLKAFFTQSNLNPLLIDSQFAETGSAQSGTKIRVLLPIEF